jgi:hypothetical protein
MHSTAQVCNVPKINCQKIVLNEEKNATSLTTCAHTNLYQRCQTFLDTTYQKRIIYLKNIPKSHKLPTYTECPYIKTPTGHKMSQNVPFQGLPKYK